MHAILLALSFACLLSYTYFSTEIEFDC